MNILARLLSHGFAVAVVVLLAIGLIYRGELFPDLQRPAFLTADSGTVPADGTESADDQPETPPIQEPESAQTSTVDMAVTEPPAAPAEAGSGVPAEEAAASPATETPAPVALPGDEVPADEVAAMAPPSTVESPGHPEMTDTGTREEPAMVPESAAHTEVEPTATGQMPTIPPVTTSVPGSMKAGIAPPAETGQAATDLTTESQAGESLSAATDEVPGAAPESSPSVATPEAKRPYELLAAAREAYWLHDYDLAEENYRKWAELEPDNPDGYGELGNLFFSQGKWEEAASAYYEAGVRLVKSGNIQPARELLEVIRGLNGAQSEDLERLIQQSKMNGHR